MIHGVLRLCAEKGVTSKVDVVEVSCSVVQSERSGKYGITVLFVKQRIAGFEQFCPAQTVSLPVVGMDGSEKSTGINLIWFYTEEVKTSLACEDDLHGYQIRDVKELVVLMEGFFHFNNQRILAIDVQKSLGYEFFNERIEKNIIVSLIHDKGNCVHQMG